MKIRFLIVTGLLAIFAIATISGQEVIRAPLRLRSCYAGNKVNRIYVPPPKEFFTNAGRKGGATVTMVYSGFPASVIVPMNYAASILESLLPAGTHITIKARWLKISTTGVLAQSSATGFVSGASIDAFKPFAFYPLSLAEKISGKSLNRSADGDIQLYVNSSSNWYLGTDGKTSTLRYDLVTVAIHEIIHGLGFFDSMDVVSANGYYGISGVPVIYDTFVETLAGKKLIDTLSFLNPSAELKTALTSGQLYFNGPLIQNYAGTRARLYAPSTFEAGSSVAHLDENTTFQINALMTPVIDMGEAIHDPGKFTKSILGDLGWINTRIIHEKPGDTELNVSSLAIAATIKSDTLFNRSTVSITWSFDNFSTTNTTYLSSPLSDNDYIGSINVPSYDKMLQYYLSVKDCFGREFRLPSNFLKPYYSVYVGTDTVKPDIFHSRIQSVFELAKSIGISATVTDNLGVDSVYAEYVLNDGSAVSLELASKGKGVFGNQLFMGGLGLHGGDSIRYRIIAVDKAGISNSKTIPSSGWYTIHVERNNVVASRYTTDFSASSADFLSSGISISKPAGFTKSGLNTPHPYVSPEENGDSIGYTAILRTPLKFDGKGIMISLKEIVLVEPGEEGTTFGETDFYDYVVVEGSKDFGNSWFALADGYDSRYSAQWLTSFNSLLVGQNSTFVPDESMLQKHYFFPKTSSSISAGDTLMVRFRLFSDPYTNGWGWIIQDLNIEAMIDKVQETVMSPVIIYPNPGDGRITVKNESAYTTASYYSVINSTGIVVMSGMLGNGSEASLDISGNPPGLYFIVIRTGQAIRSFKYNLLK
jgi:hypothetical protein